MKALLRLVCLLLLLRAPGLAAQAGPVHGALLEFSDGRASLTELAAINDVLGTVGVRLRRVDLPPAARPLLEASARGPLSEAQKESLLRLFALSRQEVLDEARAAGRAPVIPGGGSLVTGERGVAPYPKVYDLRSMGPQDRLYARDKFARLHVNATDDGTGVDEVMTLVAGGPWTWFFLLQDGVVAQLKMSRVDPAGQGWRLSYPGLVPHGGHFHAEDGLCIAYITGPASWTMRYAAPTLPGAAMLGQNPWIDFARNAP